MKTFTTSRIAGVATLALAILPMAALTTAAHAATAPERVQTSDLNLSSAAGQAVLASRVDGAARHFCRAERNLTMKSTCESAVRQEASEKASNNVRLASRI